jgi:tRNA(Arg) A34 adenosine deaminase TadA
MYREDIMNSVILEAEEYSGADVPVAASVAIGCDIISICVNDVESTGIPWNHAEFLAVQNALLKIGDKYLEEAVLYVTLEPCAFCAAVLEKVRIGGIFFGAYDPKCGAIFHNGQIFKTSTIKPEIIGGIQEERCSLILKKFFGNLRDER